MEKPRATRQAGNFPRGARPTPSNVLKAAPRFVPGQAENAPVEFAIVPAKLDYWGNDQYGDCVSAEEAFAKATYDPEIFIDESTVVDWARSHNYLNGATLGDVLRDMKNDGFAVGSQKYNDGNALTVEYSKPETLRAAIALGPVKIAIDANALPQGAGRDNGWFAVGGGKYTNTDHCVSLCGYGSAEFLFGKMGIAVPNGLTKSTQGYLLFTWSTIGFVDHAWLLNTCVEAWLRQPTTVGVPPLGPTPPPQPDGLQASIPALQVMLFGVVPMGHTNPAVAPVGPVSAAAAAPGIPAWLLAILRTVCTFAPLILQEPLRSLVLQLCAALPHQEQEGQSSHRCQEPAKAEKPESPKPEEPQPGKLA